MKFQFISDIHLELHKTIPFIEKIKDVENLFLLGDIGIPGTIIYIKFIDWCSKNFTNIFIIYGNHEYHNKKSSLVETISQRNNYMNYHLDNIFFLNNSCIFIDINNKVTFNLP